MNRVIISTLATIPVLGLAFALAGCPDETKPAETADAAAPTPSATVSTATTAPAPSAPPTASAPADGAPPKPDSGAKPKK
jgi:hypothetical protein